MTFFSSSFFTILIGGKSNIDHLNIIKTQIDVNLLRTTIFFILKENIQVQSYYKILFFF